MSETFHLVNKSRDNERSKSVGEADDWEFETMIPKLGWNLSDRVIAKGTDGTKYIWNGALARPITPGLLQCVSNDESKNRKRDSKEHKQALFDMSKSDPLDVFKNKVHTLWPWTRDVTPQISKEQLDVFYEDTYGFGDDDWTHRLVDGADEDELQRQVFTVLLCLEFSFDGSSKRKPSLWRFWRKLHKEVICPAFIKKSAIDLHTQYIRWPAAAFKLEESEGLTRALWHKVYDNVQTSAEEKWILDNFYSWAIHDRERSKKDSDTENPPQDSSSDNDQPHETKNSEKRKKKSSRKRISDDQESDEPKSQPPVKTQPIINDSTDKKDTNVLANRSVKPMTPIPLTKSKNKSKAKK